MRGCRAVVPFGKSKVYAGLILRTHQQAPPGVEVRPITEVLDTEPVVNERQLQFWQWIAHYYMCPLGDVYKAALPGRMKTPKAPPGTNRSKVGAGELSAEGCMAELNPAQSRAMQELEQAFATKDIALLHGVTSSGKTEIYIHLIADCIRQGRQVLYLLPEIALTTQITERLRRVFADRMCVYHSKFSEAQRLSVYCRQASEKPFDLVLGVRSSLLLPFQRLGLVIVDEEHDASYKQQEPAPRYHARSAAMVLARMFGAKTLLGTATPSFEAYHAARSGRYGYVQLTERYMDMKLPEVHIVDIGEQRQKKRMRGAYSSTLIEEIGGALSRGEQAILFQNRRGFAHFVMCRQCGWVPRCPHCDVSLTYHKRTEMLTCHYCGYTVSLPERCPCCGETSLADIGLGTEKAEDQLASLFPEARILRMDLDVAKTRSQYERIINDFSERRADILIGTQMVTKGLDFSGVSVIGVLDANAMLNLPDFRSYERAFQTLSQVAGRAGRRTATGCVVLQTRTADSEIISQIASNDYWGMFYQQMTERRDFHYPPFTRLIYVYMRHRDASLLDHLAEELAGRMRQAFGPRVLGPDRPPVSRIQSLHIRKIMLKLEPSMPVDKVRQTLYALQQQTLSSPVAKNLNIYYDVDPM
jgi:primosomal protein N' (replication factor Y)